MNHQNIIKMLDLEHDGGEVGITQEDFNKVWIVTDFYEKDLSQLLLADIYLTDL